MRIIVPVSNVTTAQKTFISVTPCDCTSIVTVNHHGYLKTAPWQIETAPDDRPDRDEAFRAYLFSLWIKYPNSYIRLLWQRDLSKELISEQPWMKRLKERIDTSESLVEICLENDISLSGICTVVDRSPFGRYPDDWEGDGVPPTESIVFLIDDAMAATEAIRFARRACEPTLLVA